LGFFEEGLLKEEEEQQQENNKMSSDMRSVPDIKIHVVKLVKVFRRYFVYKLLFLFLPNNNSRYTLHHEQATVPCKRRSIK